MTNALFALAALAALVTVALDAYTDPKQPLTECRYEVAKAGASPELVAQCMEIRGFRKLPNKIYQAQWHQVRAGGGTQEHTVLAADPDLWKHRFAFWRRDIDRSAVR